VSIFKIDFSQFKGCCFVYNFCRFLALYKGLLPKIMRLGPGKKCMFVGSLLLSVVDQHMHILQTFPVTLSATISRIILITVYN